MANLYTVLLNFSDHLIGINQIEAASPEEAVRAFIEKSESLEGYDRVKLAEHLGKLLHIAGNAGNPKRYHGFWEFTFDPQFVLSEQWPNDNPVYGGHVIQTDPNGPTWEPTVVR